MSTEREKWSTSHLPEGYPTKCDIEQIRNVIQDLSDERYQKIQGGKLNKIWESLISNLLKSGYDELTQRAPIDKSDTRKIKGVYLRVGGDMINDGTILTDKDAIVDIGVAGQYKSKKGKIVQGKEFISGNKTQEWFSMDNPIVWIIASLIFIILVAAIWYWADKTGFPLKFGYN